MAGEGRLEDHEEALTPVEAGNILPLGDIRAGLAGHLVRRLIDAELEGSDKSPAGCSTMPLSSRQGASSPCGPKASPCK